MIDNLCIVVTHLTQTSRKRFASVSFTCGIFILWFGMSSSILASVICICGVIYTTAVIESVSHYLKDRKRQVSETWDIWKHVIPLLWPKDRRIQLCYLGSCSCIILERSLNVALSLHVAKIIGMMEHPKVWKEVVVYIVLKCFSDVVPTLRNMTARRWQYHTDQQIKTMVFNQIMDLSRYIHSHLRDFMSRDGITARRLILHGL